MARWFWWFLAMLPFCWVVFQLAVGLSDATSKQASGTAANLVSAARYLTAVSWCAYPLVYIIKNIGLAGPAATVYEQIGYRDERLLARGVPAHDPASGDGASTMRGRGRGRGGK